MNLVALHTLHSPVAIFLLVLVMILVTPVMLRRLGVPHIVGMILAGIVVGPHCLGLLERDASFEIFGQVGILYLMFLAGVEIDMLGLRRSIGEGIRFGLLSFLLPCVAGLLVTRYVLGCGWLTSALVASMLSSHTLISYPIVTRFALSSTRASIVAVCGTIVSVLLALVLLAQVVAVSEKGVLEPWPLMRLFALMLVYAGGVWWLFTRLTRWFLRHFPDRVTQFIFILAEVLLASLLAQLIGLEPILGAFYAGLVLNKFIPSRSGLMTRLEFVGNAIFIPYFLIGVGMLMDINVIVKGWNVLYIALVMTASALVCKWGAAMVSGKIMGLSGAGRRLLFGLTSGKAAATIAAVMVGYRYHLLSEDLMNGAVIMILICCGVASVVTERAAKQMRLARAKQDYEPADTQRAYMARQLVAVANPMTAEGIMRLALFMRHPANRHPVTGLYIRTGEDSPASSMGKQALSDITRVALSTEVKVNEVIRYDVNIAAGITNAFKEHDCSEIILGLHRKSNIVDTFFGQILETLLRTCNRMVTMCRMFSPLQTLKKIEVIVPAKAQYETGFSLWLTRLGMLAQQTSLPIRFIATSDTVRYIRGGLKAMGFDLRVSYLEAENGDDLITASGKIGTDDLVVAIGARKTSVSHSAWMDQLPNFLQRHFSRHNLLVIYPEQFGQEAELPEPIDTLSVDIPASPGGWSWRNLFFKP